jgi:hypothetical protein
VAEIEWKGAVWRAAYGSLSVKELLTILKGFGPMETLAFEKPGCCRGEISISLSGEGKKEITLYNLEVLGPRRKGTGRAALQWLRSIFKGDLFVEDPGFITVKGANRESLLFWVRMFREGLIDALDAEAIELHPQMSDQELLRLESEILGGPGNGGASTYLQ